MRFGLVEENVLEVFHHFVLYSCEAWSLTSREEQKLMVFKNRILRRIFTPKRDENG